MANKLKRILALMMALSLLAGQVAVPAAATENTEHQATIEITVSEPVTTVSQNPETGATEKTTTTTTTWSGMEGSTVTSGSETTTTVTNTTSGTTTNTTTTNETVTDTDTGSSTNTQATNTQTVTTSGNTTNTDNTWSSTTTETSTDFQPGNPSVQTDTNKTITVTGSEESTEKVTSDGCTQTTTGSLQGQETTDIVDTTTTITTETDKYLYDDIDDDDPPILETLPGEDITEGEWKDGTPSNNDWIDGALVPGTGEDLGTPVPVPGETTDVTPDTPGATLVLDPNKLWVENKTIITLKEVSDGKYPEPKSTKDYTVVELKDGDKLIGWEITWNTTESTDATPFHTKNLTPDADWTSSGDIQPTVVRPTGYKVDEEGTTVGNVTTKVEEILDKDGKFLGYKVTKITVDNFDNADKPVESASDDLTQVIPGTEEANGFQRPVRPDESTTTNSYGDVTTVTVTDLIENGKHVGYTINTVTVDKKGTLLYTETKNIYGTASTIRTDVEIDPTTEMTTTYTTVTKTEVEEIFVTENARIMELVQQRLEQYDTTLVTEQDTYQLVNGKDGNMYFLYKGIMYAVTGTNTIGNFYDVAANGKVPMTGYTDADDLRMLDETVKNDKGATITIKDYYTNQTFDEDDTNQNGTWRHVGYGLFSDFTMADTKGHAHSAKHFKIKDGDQIRYVYCVELGAGIDAGTYYSPGSYDQNNDNVPPWTNEDGTATGTVQQLRSVALNGFWGTETGLGSLDAVKELMRRNNLSAEADRMTAGMAIAATQAAIWEFAALDPHDSNTAPKFEGDFLTFDDEEGAAPNENTADAIIALRDLLVSLAKDAGTNGEGAAQAITTETITGSVIKVGDKVTDSSGKEQTDAQGNTLYHTDLSFTMEVSTSSINGDLVLEVSDANGRPIGKYRLAGDPGKSIYDAFTTRIRPDETGTYVLENLQLAENVAINLNLKGIQHLDDGVYIYKGEEDMQDFIGLSQKENKVDLNISMEFSVEDPTVTHTHTKTTQHRTDSQIDTKTDYRTDHMTAKRTVTSGTLETENDYKISVYGTVTTTKIEKDITKKNRSWKAYWTRLLNLVEEGEEGDDPSAPDAEVPLANAPKTGDLSRLWAAVSLASLSAMFLLARKEDEE